MSFREYLHEKAEESRHMETVAYIIFLTGAVLLVGGILEALSLPSEPNWFLILPYGTQPGMATYLGFTLVIGGIVMAVAGIAFGLNHSRQRGWYMQELRKAGAPADHPFFEKSSGSSPTKSGREPKKKQLAN